MSGSWTGKVPSTIPANQFVRIRIVGVGNPPCVSNGNCTNVILAESSEFITFNNKSVVTRLPDNGIRSTVPGPTNTTTRTSSTPTPIATPIVTHLVTSTSVNAVLTSDTVTATPNSSS